MSSPSYNTQGKPEQQDWADQEWEEIVKSGLPTNLEEKAIELKAWCRQRGVSSITDLLRALLVYTSSGYSFQDLGAWATDLRGGQHQRNGMAKTVRQVGLVDRLVGSRYAQGWTSRE